MDENDPQELPPHGRLISAGLVSASVLALLLNHYAVESRNVAYLMILGLAPISLFIGLGGIIEPKILWSVGKYGKHLPVSYKIMGGILGAVGVAVTFLLLFLVYQLGPTPRVAKPARPFALPRLPKPVAKVAKAHSDPPAPVVKAERSVAAPEAMYLTYVRPQKRWKAMDATALQGVHRENTNGTTKLQYVEGEHSLLKVLWPDVLAIGERFVVELQSTNSVELVDTEGDDANARTTLPVSDRFVVVEFTRDQDQFTITCDGQLQSLYYASGKLRGNEAKAALLAASLRPGFSVKKGEQASFRNARIVKP